MTDNRSHEAVIVEAACERYLGWVAECRRDMERLERDRNDMRSTMDMLKAVRYDRVGSGASMQHGDDAMASVVARLEAVDDAIVEKSADYAQAVAEWHEVSYRLPAVEAEALDLHYVKGMPWEQVAERVRYSERSVYRIRMDALYDLYEQLPQGWQ